jgi:hypothetical protein
MYHLAEFLNKTALGTPNYVENLLKTAQSKNITVGEWNMFIKQFKALISQDSQTYLAFQAVLKDLENASVQIPYKLDVGINPNTVRQVGSHAGQKAFHLDCALRTIDDWYMSKSYTLRYVDTECTAEEFIAQVKDLQNKVNNKRKLPYTVRLMSQHYNYGNVTKVSIDENLITATVEVDNFCIERDEEGNSIAASSLPLIWFLDEPELGTYHLGDYSYSTGLNNYAQGLCSEVSGRSNKAYGWYSHVEGLDNTGYYLAHVEGKENIGVGDVTHTEGWKNIAYGKMSHAEGFHTRAIADHSHAEGCGADLKPTISNDSGLNGVANVPELRTALFQNEYALVDSCWDATKYGDPAGGLAKTGAYGYNSHVEGYGCYVRAGAIGAHVEGHRNCVLNLYGHSEGYYNVTYGQFGHSEGSYGIAYGDSSHSEGWTCVAYGNQSHAEGWQTYAKGLAAHSEGARTQALAKCSHAAGKGTKTGYREGDEGYCEGQYVIGLWNAVTDAAFIIGKGTSEYDRRNVFEVYKNGDIVIDGIRLTRSQLARLATI